jgi:hypothetical protein
MTVKGWFRYHQLLRALKSEGVTDVREKKDSQMNKSVYFNDQLIGEINYRLNNDSKSYSETPYFISGEIGNPSEIQLACDAASWNLREKWYPKN